MQERTVQAGQKKVRKTKRLVRRFNLIQTLQTVEEDGPVEEPSSAIALAENNDPTTCDCLRELEKVLRKKVRRSGNIKRVRHPQRKRIKVRVPFVGGMIPGHRRLAPRGFPSIIRLYSCSAVRYAMFRSNRRFKPGD